MSIAQPNQVSSAALVLLQFNTQDDRFVKKVPEWVSKIKETPRPASITDTQPQTKNEPVVAKRIDFSLLIEDLVDAGFVPVKFSHIERERGHRFVLVCVRKDKVDESAEGHLSSEQLSQIKGIFLAEELWDYKRYRNVTPDGGNFIYDCGNARPAHSSKSNGLELIVEGEFQTVLGETAESEESPFSIGAAISML